MRKTMLILRHEIDETLRNPGYVIFAYLLPVVLALALVGLSRLQPRLAGTNTDNSDASSQFGEEVEGYVDQSGLVRHIPSNIPPGRLLQYDDEAQAQQALQIGEVEAYYLVPPDVLERGVVDYVYPNSRSYLDDGKSWVMAWTLMFNYLDGQANLADQIWNPVQEVTATSLASAGGTPAGEDCSRPGAACRTNDLVRYMPSLMVALFFASFMTSSSRLFNSVGVEKENRLIEVLLVSVSPRQLLAGKTIGLGMAGLLQAALWLSAFYIAFNLGGAVLKLPPGFVFPLDILFWGLAFFLGGYSLYASLMAGAGALAPSLKEAGMVNIIAMFPLFFGYAFGLMAPLTGSADSPFLVVLSLFPLTSPVVMIMRLTNSTVPFWQLILSFCLLVASAGLALRSAAAMFHAHNLLSGQPFSLRRYFTALVG